MSIQIEKALKPRVVERFKSLLECFQVIFFSRKTMNFKKKKLAVDEQNIEISFAPLSTSHMDEKKSSINWIPIKKATLLITMLTPACV
ncbi:MAG TPA: hypothetical protein VFK37_06225, partial [Bacillales bacterium]|nr:hypothetical protein [Bacillales bacterium]